MRCYSQSYWFGRDEESFDDDLPPILPTHCANPPLPSERVTGKSTNVVSHAEQLIISHRLEELMFPEAFSPNPSESSASDSSYASSVFPHTTPTDFKWAKKLNTSQLSRLRYVRQWELYHNDISIIEQGDLLVLSVEPKQNVEDQLDIDESDDESEDDKRRRSKMEELFQDMPEECNPPYHFRLMAELSTSFIWVWDDKEEVFPEFEAEWFKIKYPDLSGALARWRDGWRRRYRVRGERVYLHELFETKFAQAQWDIEGMLLAIRLVEKEDVVSVRYDAGSLYHIYHVTKTNGAAALKQLILDLHTANWFSQEPNHPQTKPSIDFAFHQLDSKGRLLSNRVR